jgi:hypothetical protein
MPDWEALQDKARIGPKFGARYDGHCVPCGTAFDEGDAVGYVDDELCCEDCYDEAALS